MEKRVEVLGKKTRVFEISKEAEIADQANDKPKFACALAPFHQHDHVIVDGGRGEKEQQIPGVPPTVEGVGSNHQPDIHQPVVLADEKIDGVDNREKDKKSPGVKEHRSTTDYTVGNNEIVHNEIRDPYFGGVAIGANLTLMLLIDEGRADARLTQFLMRQFVVRGSPGVVLDRVIGAIRG
jgi:hypothetical protein